MPQFKHAAPLMIGFLVVLFGSFQGQAQPTPTGLANINDPIVFNNPPPPPIGQPGRRSDAGSRGCVDGSSSNSSAFTSLLALAPIQETERGTVVFGKTAAEYPTFWFYVPHDSLLTAVFVLQDQEGNPVYESDVPLPLTSGNMSLTLPPTVAPLETGEPYHWFFKLYCRSISPPDFFVDGWIQRESLTANLTQRLETASPQQQMWLYADNGLWFDALTMAAELRGANSEASAWAELLRVIGLETVAAEAIVTP